MSLDKLKLQASSWRSGTLGRQVEGSLDRLWSDKAVSFPKTVMEGKMTWSTSNPCCGTCRHWSGHRQIKQISDRKVAEFPSASERGKCGVKGDNRGANQGTCGDYSPKL